jgi:hypothetical protein
MPGKMTRRFAVGLLSAGGVAGALVGTLRGAEAVAPPVAASKEPLDVLTPGARFGRWTIEAVHPIERGSLRVDVRQSDQANGGVFPLEILHADPSASRPPAQAGELAIYVRNGGDGWAPTEEEQGLAAMTLASLLQKHGATGAIDGLLTQAARFAAHGDVLTGINVI